MTDGGLTTEGSGLDVDDVRVLVVDDHPAFLRTAEFVIAATPGFVVSGTATNAEEALTELTCDRDIDLVLLDVNLPDRSGIELARAYAASDGTAMVVLMSTAELGDLPGDALAAGVAGFVPKEQLTTTALRAIWGAAAR